MSGMGATKMEDSEVGTVTKDLTPFGKESRPRGITALVGYEVLSGIAILGILLLVLPSVESIGYFVIETLIFYAAGVGSFIIAYGLWKGLSWAWWVTIIQSLIGIVVFWPNLLIMILELAEGYLERHTITPALGISIIAAYIASHAVPIVYLLRSHVKAFFNVHALVESGQKVIQARLPFIDFTRGMVMILMAWDHVSVFWNPGRRGSEGLFMFPDGVAQLLRPDFPNFTQFLLRFISHWCAPTFIFLAGTALALSTAKRLAQGDSQRDISLRMIKRGGVLLLLEAFVVSPAFFYYGPVPYLYFGVIACIGVGIILFSVLRRVPPLAILGLSLFIILGQPFFTFDWLWEALIRLGVGADLRWYLKVILFKPNFEWVPLVGLYPLIPWIGVMGLGWCFGLFLTSYERTQIPRLTRPLMAAGGVSLGLWFVVRLLNDYGNRLPRLETTDNMLQDWLLMAKYPPSIAFLLWTLGGMCFMLALGLFLQTRTNFTRGITGAILTFGQVPLFFYCIHIWLYRLWVGWWERPTSFSTNLVGTAIFWLIGLVILWRLSLWYTQVKQRYPDSLLKYI